MFLIGIKTHGFETDWAFGHFHFSFEDFCFLREKVKMRKIETLFNESIKKAKENDVAEQIFIRMDSWLLLFKRKFEKQKKIYRNKKI